MKQLSYWLKSIPKVFALYAFGYKRRNDSPLTLSRCIDWIEEHPLLFTVSLAMFSIALSWFIVLKWIA